MSDEEFTDKYARERIERLERRLEGAHLTPSFWVITKQSFQAISSWKGWEIFGIGSMIFLGIFLLGTMVFGVNRGCAADTRAEDAPTCEALGLTYSGSRGNGNIVCTGSDRVVTVNPSDIDETEVHMIDGASSAE